MLRGDRSLEKKLRVVERAWHLGQRETRVTQVWTQCRKGLRLGEKDEPWAGCAVLWLDQPVIETDVSDKQVNK